MMPTAGAALGAPGAAISLAGRAAPAIPRHDRVSGRVGLRELRSTLDGVVALPGLQARTG